MLRLVLRVSIASVLSAASTLACTSTQEQLGQTGDRCDDTLQCAQPLACACVVKGQPDPEGNEETIRFGMCEPKSFDTANCPQDGGVDAPAIDTQTPETEADSGAEAETAAESGADVEAGGD